MMSASSADPFALRPTTYSRAIATVFVCELQCLGLRALGFRVLRCGFALCRDIPAAPAEIPAFRAISSEAVTLLGVARNCKDTLLKGPCNKNPIM